MSGRVLAGSVLVIVGVAALLAQFTSLHVGGLIADWWPLVIIVIGAVQLVTRSAPVFGAVFMVVAGIVLQLWTLGILNVSIWAVIFPLLIVSIGVSLLVPRGWGRSWGRTSSEGGDELHDLAMFSGYESRVESTSFRGGRVTAIFGGMEIDLRGATMAPEGAEIEATAAFGGMELRVPETWRVEITGLPLFGGWSNKTATAKPKGATADTPAPAGTPVLKIKAFVAFGGFEVKN
jgi:hypothetical protein